MHPGIPSQPSLLSRNNDTYVTIRRVFRELLSLTSSSRDNENATPARKHFGRFFEPCDFELLSSQQWDSRGRRRPKFRKNVARVARIVREGCSA